MGRYDGPRTNRCRYLCEDVAWNYRLSTTGNSPWMGYLEEIITRAGHDDTDVGKPDDQKTTEQDTEEMAMGQGDAADPVAL